MHFENRRIVDFAVRWAPYGGPPAEDILVEFGMSSRRFYQQLKDIVLGCPMPDTERAVLTDKLKQIVNLNSREAEPIPAHDARGEGQTGSMIGAFPRRHPL